MRIVVTGLSGHLGTALLHRLAAPGGEHEIVGVSRRPPEGREPYSAAEWVCVDLATDVARAQLREVFDGADAVVHLAWTFQPARDVGYVTRATLGGSRAVLAAADAARVPHLVCMSSGGVYSGSADAAPHRQARAADEHHSRRGVPSLGYSRQKVAVEDDLDAYETSRPGRHRTAIARLRPGLVLHRAVGGALLRYAARPIAFSAVSGDDVASAAVAVLERGATHAFNLAAEPALTREDIAEAFAASGVVLPVPLLRGAAGLAWRAQLAALDPPWADLAGAVPLLDSTRARAELGWSPATDARGALRELVSQLTAVPAASGAARRLVGHRRLP